MNHLWTAFRVQDGTNFKSDQELRQNVESMYANIVGLHQQNDKSEEEIAQLKQHFEQMKFSIRSLKDKNQEYRQIMIEGGKDETVMIDTVVAQKFNELRIKIDVIARKCSFPEKLYLRKPHHTAQKEFNSILNNCSTEWDCVSRLRARIFEHLNTNILSQRCFGFDDDGYLGEFEKYLSQTGKEDASGQKLR